MRFIPLTVCAMLLCVPAKADKFWLSDPQAEQNAAEGSSPNLIEGVLIAESDEGYHVRIVGGEIILPKQSVYKIEKDALSLDNIVAAEKDAAAAGEQANEERRLTQEIRRREREIRVAEASARRSARAVDASVTPEPLPAPVFDPVLGVFGDGGASDQELMIEAQIGWERTHDRRYLKLLRQLRRLR
jgi:hypothetical protein